MNTETEPEVPVLGHPTCETCRSYYPLNDEQGECRRMTPTADKEGIGRWPKVTTYDWCSQHKPTDTPKKTGPSKEYDPNDLLPYFAGSLEQAKGEDNYHVIERAEAATGVRYGPYHVNIAKSYLHKRGMLTKKNGKYFRSDPGPTRKATEQPRGPEPSYDIDEDIIPHYPTGEGNAEPISVIAKRIGAMGKASASAVYRCRAELLRIGIIVRRDDGAYYRPTEEEEERIEEERAKARFAADELPDLD